MFRVQQWSRHEWRLRRLTRSRQNQDLCAVCCCEASTNSNNSAICVMCEMRVHRACAPGSFKGCGNSLQVVPWYVQGPVCRACHEGD